MNKPIDTSNVAGKIAVMQAFEQGHEVQFKKHWMEKYEDAAEPTWDWSAGDYRLKPREPREFWLGMSEADEDSVRRGYALLVDQASAEYLREKCGWHEVIKVREVQE